MSVAAALASLCRAIDAHAWDELSAHLSPSFRCRYVHTGEEFDRAAWVRLDADYPGFDHLVVEELVDGGDQAVAFCHVTGWTGESLAHFAVATFVRCDTSGIVEMTEVWTDTNQAPPPEGR